MDHRISWRSPLRAPAHVELPETKAHTLALTHESARWSGPVTGMHAWGAERKINPTQFSATLTRSASGSLLSAQIAAGGPVSEVPHEGRTGHAYRVAVQASAAGLFEGGRLVENANNGQARYENGELVFTARETLFTQTFAKLPEEAELMATLESAAESELAHQLGLKRPS